jgi:hypothetical protein
VPGRTNFISYVLKKQRKEMNRWKTDDLMHLVFTPYPPPSAYPVIPKNFVCWSYWSYWTQMNFWRIWIEKSHQRTNGLDPRGYQEG